MVQKETAELKKLLMAMARRTAPEETMTMRKPELAMQEWLREQTTKNADKAVGRYRCSLRPQACATIGCTEDLF